MAREKGNKTEPQSIPLRLVVCDHCHDVVAAFDTDVEVLNWQHFGCGGLLKYYEIDARRVK